MNPQGPCFIASSQGYFIYESNYTSATPCKTLDVLKGFFHKMIVYDKTGQRWMSKEVIPDYNSRKWGFTDNTKHVSKVSVKVIWQTPQPYHIADLKGVYVKAIEEDDYIRNHPALLKMLKMKITQTYTFESLLEVYQWMQGEVHKNKS